MGEATSMDPETNRARYIASALEQGAAHAVAFTPDDIVFDPRTLLKCMFGCSDWGLGPTCPSRPGALKPSEYEDMLRRYSWGIIIHSPSKKIAQEVSYALEKQAFRDGYHLAFSMSDCACCANGCVAVEKRTGVCVNPKKARPAFHSVGIDVFRTVHGFGLPLETLPVDDDPDQNWYSAVWID